MSERLKFQGRLSEAKLHAKDLRMKIDGLRKSIRDNLDPFDDVADLNLELVASQAIEVAELQIQYKETLATIEAIEKVLG